ncbi:DUF2332 family protein [Micromonospora sp. NPDC049175]|uniref:DUF2332 family protein n=1 Tax=Micromonospora sp. NPDC049175 TaxID=3364266 RepID=UPI00371C4BBD
MADSGADSVVTQVLRHIKYDRLEPRLRQMVADDEPTQEILVRRRPVQQPSFLLFGAVHHLLLGGVEHELRDFHPSLVGTSARNPAAAGLMRGLSLTPPMLLICVNSVSSNLAHIRSRGLFAVNLLSDRGRAAADLFASHCPDRFAGTRWRTTTLRQLPFLVDAAQGGQRVPGGADGYGR